MAKPVEKWNIPLKLDGIEASIKGNPKAFNNHEKYGKTLWVEATKWDDGGLSIGNFNSETKTNYNIGSGKPKEMSPTMTNKDNAPQKKEADFEFDIN